MNRIVFCLWIALAMVYRNETPETAAAEIPPGVSVEYSVEKAYGYFIGDVVKVTYSLALPPDQLLRKDSLPGESAARGEWVEVRGRKISEKTTRDMRTYTLELIYQVFSSSDMARTFEIPKVEFSYGPRNAPSGNSSAWASVPITVSPLTSPEDEFQPPLLWSWRSSAPQIIRVAGAALLLGSIGFAVFLFQKKVRRHSPLGDGLKRLSREKNPQTALIIFRNALNEKAGRAIFPTNLEDLFRVFPEARACEDELLNLVRLSDEASFNPKSSKVGDGLLRRVAATMKKMKRLETWA